MAVNVVKIPVPNSQACIVRIAAKVLDIVEYRVLTVQAKQRVEIPGMPRKLTAHHWVWAVVEYGQVDEQGNSEFVEDHNFVIVETMALIPEVPFQLNYIGIGMLPLQDGSMREFHCFHGGVNLDYVGKDLPKQGLGEAQGHA